MRRRLLTAFNGLLALIALVSMPWLGWVEAGRQGYSVTSEVATRYARDVLYRADKTAAQARDTVARLDAAGFDACSVPELKLMGHLDLSSSYIQGLGRIQNGLVQCSSVNTLKFDLGKDGYRSPSGAIVHSTVTYGSQAPGEVMALQWKNFIVFINRDLPLDTWTGSLNVELGVFQMDRPASSGPEVARGDVKRVWLTHLAGLGDTSFIDGGRIVAVVRSTQFRIAAVAAIPIMEFETRRNAIAFRLVPAGALAGLVAAAAIVSLGRRQRSLAAALRSGLRQKEFFLQYQPIIALTNGQCVGAEALMRWRRATGELVGPDLFIPVAEQSSLMTSMTQRVFELVQSDAGPWLADHPDFHIAINLSAVDFHSITLVNTLDKFMHDTCACPQNLILEITERSLMDVGVARDVIHALHERGYNIAIDDFGTGYSSLSYLQSLQLDILKIDRSFVETIGMRAPTSNVVNHIIAMARDIGMRIIAEGVERTEQAEHLTEHGVQYAQGWLFGRPTTFEEIKDMIKIPSQKLT